MLSKQPVYTCLGQMEMAHSQLKSVHNDACIYYVLVKWLVYAWPSKTARNDILSI
jgi:hypothetical protein